MSTVVIASALIELEIPASTSLKDKRGVVRSLIVRLRREYNLAVAEVGALDERQRSHICLVTVSNDKRYANGLLQRAITAIDTWRLDCELVSYEIEIW